MNKNIVFAPKPKFIIPKIRPSLFSLNEDEFEIESDIINNEEKLSIKVEQDEKDFDEEEEVSRSYEKESDYSLKYTNSIFKALKRIHTRDSSNSLETRDSDD